MSILESLHLLAFGCRVCSGCHCSGSHAVAEKGRCSFEEAGRA